MIHYLDNITAENYLGDMTITQAQDAEIENDQFVAGDIQHALFRDWPDQF